MQEEEGREREREGTIDRGISDVKNICTPIAVRKLKRTNLR